MSQQQKKSHEKKVTKQKSDKKPKKKTMKKKNRIKSEVKKTKKKITAWTKQWKKKEINELEIDSGAPIDRTMLARACPLICSSLRWLRNHSSLFFRWASRMGWRACRSISSWFGRALPDMASDASGPPAAVGVGVAAPAVGTARCVLEDCGDATTRSRSRTGGVMGPDTEKLLVRELSGDALVLPLLLMSGEASGDDEHSACRRWARSTHWCSSLNRRTEFLTENTLGAISVTHTHTHTNKIYMAEKKNGING